MDYIKAVIFDMDGVLIDAKEWHYEALNRALDNFGYCISRSEHLSIYDGLPTRTKLELLHQRDGFPENLYEIVNQQKQQYTLEIADQQCQPYRLHQEAITWLKSQGYALCVASNSIRATVNRLLEKAGILDDFDFTLSNEDVNHPKPHPEIYQTAIARLALQPDQCLVIEDHPYGVEAARQAGAQVMQIRSVAEVNRDQILDFIGQLTVNTTPTVQGDALANRNVEKTLRKAG